MIQNLDGADKGSRQVVGGDVVLSAQQVQAFDVEVGYILAQVFYFPILSDMDAGNLTQGVLQGEVPGSREGGEAEGEGIPSLGNHGSSNRYFLERQVLFFQYNVLALRAVFQG